MADKGVLVPEDGPQELSTDTAVRQSHGKFAAEVTLRWNNFGRPVGAILAATLVRAASLEAEMPTVVSATTEFLNSAQTGLVEVACEVVRRSSMLCCVNSRAVQGERTLCQGTTWLSAGAARQIRAATPPEAPNWTKVPTIDERLGPGAFAFSNVLEFRPVTWIDDYANRPESVPYSLTWARFRSASPARDLVTKACEVLVVGDVLPPMAMMTASPQHEATVAGVQTISLSAHIGSLEDDSEQLLIETACESMSSAVLSSVVRVWTESMALRGQVTASYRLPKASA